MAKARVTFTLTHDDLDNMPGTVPELTDKITKAAQEHGFTLNPPTVFVVTYHSQSELTTETAGGFLSLHGAREYARTVAEATESDVAVFIEEWRGADFHAQRELRATGEWYLSESPNFAPIKES